MNTKNTKTAVIILLVIANLFFIYNIMSLKISSENITSEMIDNAVNILEKKEFIVDRNIIPVKKPSSWIYEGEYKQDLFRFDIVKNFSGVSDGEELAAGEMWGPYGISYAAGDYKFMFSDIRKQPLDSQADYFKNYFKISIIDKNYSASDIDFEKLEEEAQRNMAFLAEKGISENQKGDIKKAGKIIKNFIKKYQNQDVKLGFEIIGYEEDRYKNCECAAINQTVDGVRVDFHIVYIEIQDGEVKYFSGNWYFGGLSVLAKRMPLLDSVNILFKCIDADKNIVQSEKLKKMNHEYSVIHQDTESFYFAPAWQLVFESGKTLSYDMISGDKRIKD